jgi:uncharacterized protein YutE (UPF0331/DUF86 family)
MVDPDRLVAILGRVTSRLRILDGYAAADHDVLVADRVRLGDLKYTFQTTIEACIDAAQHVVAERGLGTPASNADAFRSLAQDGVIDHRLGELMAGAVGFRNVLVHGYSDVDDERVVAHLRHLDEIRRFVTEVARLAEDEPDSSS